MFSFFLITSVIFFSRLAEGRLAVDSTLKSDTIVNYINSLHQNTWHADSYGTKEINVRDFVQSRMGAKIARRPQQYLKNNDADKLTVEINEPHIDESRHYAADSGNDLPTTFSWVNKTLTKCPTENIRDQSNCGSCWAVASVAALSDRICIKSKGRITMPLSSTHVIGCNTKNYGCSGGYMYYLYEFLKENGTVSGGEYESDLGCQPYSIRPCGYPPRTNFPCASSLAMNPKCRETKCTNAWYPTRYEKKKYTISDYYYVGSSVDEYSIRKEIFVNGTVTATFWVYPDFMYYKGGIYEHKYGWWPIGGHAVRIVGWGEENGVKYWQVANSWGDQWGENGFFRIIRGTNNCWFESGVQAAIPKLK